jgi:hypothetical protein
MSITILKKYANQEFFFDWRQSMSSSIKVIGYTLMVDRWFGVGQFLSAPPYPISNCKDKEAGSR